jgi:DNA (cytosine-5)-methyltransferase 1
MVKPKLLDLFCGAGGCADGYHSAGFEVIGVDNKPMPNFPYTFYQCDAFEYLLKHGKKYDFIHASPPCQAYTVLKAIHKNKHPDLVAKVRELLIKNGKPYVIENVPQSPLIDPILLCGKMFGLGVYRHRLFESSVGLFIPKHKAHHWPRTFAKGKDTTAPRGSYDRGQRGVITVAGHNFCKKAASEAMGINWMTTKELSQAIPPAYTEFIGRQLLKNF